MLQVLTDLCQLTEGLLRLQRVWQQVSVADNLRPAPEGGGGDANAQQQQKIAAALAAVPQYCCCADLMQKATPELLRLVLSFSDSDISRLFVDTFYETAALLELANRSSEPPAAGAPAQLLEQLPSATHQRAVLAACCSRGSTPSAAGTSTENNQPSHSVGPRQDSMHAQPVGEQLGAGAASDMQTHTPDASELEMVVDKFVAVMVLIHLLEPLPIIEAACINHRTQEKGESHPQHWLVSGLCSRAFIDTVPVLLSRHGNSLGCGLLPAGRDPAAAAEVGAGRLPACWHPRGEGVSDLWLAACTFGQNSSILHTLGCLGYVRNLPLSRCAMHRPITLLLRMHGVMPASASAGAQHTQEQLVAAEKCAAEGSLTQPADPGSTAAAATAAAGCRSAVSSKYATR